MKVGDTIPVNIGGAQVADAKITEMADGTATLVIPATKVVMGVRTELETQPVAAPPTPEHAILGLENESTPDTPVNEAAVAADANAVLDTPEPLPAPPPVEHETVGPVTEVVSAEPAQSEPAPTPPTNTEA